MFFAVSTLNACGKLSCVDWTGAAKEQQLDRLQVGCITGDTLIALAAVVIGVLKIIGILKGLPPAAAYSLVGVGGGVVLSWIIGAAISCGQSKELYNDAQPEHTLRIQLGERCIEYTDTKMHLTPEESLISIDLEDRVSEENLWKLLVRKPNQTYQIGSKEWRSQEDINQELKGTVTDVITQLNDYLVRQKTISRPLELAIKMMFAKDGPLCRMSNEVFDRSAIVEGSHLEKILSSWELQNKRASLADALKDLRDTPDSKEDKRRVEATLMDLAYAEMSFMQRLGLDLEPNKDGGSGGARYARDRFGRKMLVVKPGDEGPHGVNNPQWYARVKRWVVSPKACLEGNSEPLAEYYSWACDRHFDIWSVPPTDVRYVQSADFVGQPVKQCSLQMFVADCMTLGEYVGVSPSLHGMSRPFLRWYCGSQEQTGFFSAFEPRTDRATELEKLPQHSLERVALHNFLIEDVDCHFENILVKVSDLQEKDPMMSQIFKGDETVSDEEIDEYVTHFFANKGNQALLNQLLFSESVTINGEEKKVTLVKHDGGSSNPHNHSTEWDFLSMRFKYLFEALPHFEKGYSDQARGLFLDKQNNLENFLKEKSERELRNILGVVDTPDGPKHVFDLFWAKQKNQETLYKFIFANHPDTAYHYRLELIAALITAADAKVTEGPSYQFYFNYHLQRIYGNIQTRLECYRVLEKHLKEPNEPMRTLFKDVRSYEDFEREKASSIVIKT